MRAIILSAGRGTRLLPLTSDIPKCLLPVRGDQSLLEVQLQTLAACGVRDVTVVTGFGADKLNARLLARPVRGMRVTTLRNPVYEVADNLISCWLARSEMRGDFLLLNGDTLFEPALLERVLASRPAPVVLAADHKPEYDDDDMKIHVQRGRLLAVGKTLPAEIANGESIGLMLFRGDGPKLFREGLERAVQDPACVRAYFLSVVDALARQTRVETLSTAGLWWGEVDTFADLEEVRAALAPVSVRRAALG